MEELVELVQAQFNVYTLSLVLLVQEVHFEVDNAFAIWLDHAVRGRYAELVLEC